MSKRKKKKKDGDESPPKDINLDSIVLHDRWLFGRIVFGATVVDVLFKFLYIPFANPKPWVAWCVENILAILMITFGAAALLDAWVSLYFYFQKRFTTRL